MKTASVVAILAAVAAATSPSSDSQMSDLSARGTDLCKGATNCEVYDTPEGQKFRFKAGMEPGTAAYEAMFGSGESIVHPRSTKEARAANVHTEITVGPTTIDYGQAVPADVIGQHLPNLCPTSGACLSADPVTVNVPFGKSHYTITISADGQYNSADRDIYVNAIVAVLKKGVSHVDDEQCSEQRRDLPQDSEEAAASDDQLVKRLGGPPPHEICTKIPVNKQTNEVSISRRDLTGELRGFMKVTITQDNSSSGWCAILTAIASGILGAIGGEVAAIGAGFFGVVGAAGCGS